MLCDMSNVAASLGLNRRKLQLMSILVGCDYSEGVRGIGIVNATEVVACFDSIKELGVFRKWCLLPNKLHAESQWLFDHATKAQQKFMKKHENYKKHWIFPPCFPDERVINAFEEPCIDAELDQNMFMRLGEFKRERLL